MALSCVSRHVASTVYLMVTLDCDIGITAVPNEARAGVLGELPEADAGNNISASASGDLWPLVKSQEICATVESLPPSIQLPSRLRRCVNFPPIKGRKTARLLPVL